LTVIIKPLLPWH